VPTSLRLTRFFRSTAYQAIEKTEVPGYFCAAESVMQPCADMTHYWFETEGACYEPFIDVVKVPNRTGNPTSRSGEH
jgi:hypothetical protein